MIFLAGLFIGFFIGLATAYIMVFVLPETDERARVANTSKTDPRESCARCGQSSETGLCSDCRSEAEVSY